MPSSYIWSGITYGSGTFAVVPWSSTSNAAYYTFAAAPALPILPVNFGIYNGPTKIN